MIEDDGGVLLAETGAVVEYILTKYGKGKLVVRPDAKNFSDYLYWLHFANGYFQPVLLRYSEYFLIDRLSSMVSPAPWCCCSDQGASQG